MRTVSQSHLTDADVAQLVAGRVTLGPAAENHLTGCDACQQRVTAARARGDDVPAELRALSQYADIRRLGGGGMGVVYLAHNTLMDRPEVLKVIGSAAGDDPQARERFLREMRAAARLSHPNVVAAYTAVQTGGTLAFAMEYVPGDDLDALVKAGGPLPVAVACDYVRQAALGLQHAHERGMVHRDIKPANLQVLTEGDRRTVKVLDFGLAKAVSEGPTAGGLTATGAVLGTPAFMAPEQTANAAAADVRADIYSLGCTLYVLLTGRLPFASGSLLDLMLAHRQAARPDPRAVRGDVPSELAAVVARMMASDPADRFQTPAEAARALAAFADGRPPEPLAPVPPPVVPPTVPLWMRFGPPAALRPGWRTRTVVGLAVLLGWTAALVATGLSLRFAQPVHAKRVEFYQALVECDFQPTPASNDEAERRYQELLKEAPERTAEKGYVTYNWLLDRCHATRAAYKTAESAVGVAAGLGAFPLGPLVVVALVHAVRRRDARRLVARPTLVGLVVPAVAWLGYAVVFFNPVVPVTWYPLCVLAAIGIGLLTVWAAVRLHVALRRSVQHPA